MKEILRSEQGSRYDRSRKLLGKLGVVLGLAATGHAAGVGVTNMFPTRAELGGNFAVEASLGLVPTSEVTVSSPVGGAQVSFDGLLSAPSVTIHPEVLATSMDTFAKDGIGGLRPNDREVAGAIREISYGLGERYIAGFLVAEALILGAYGYGARGSKRVSKRHLATTFGATLLATGSAMGAASSTYQNGNIQGYTVTGLAGAFQAQGGEFNAAVAERSKQLQPYVSSWLNLQDLLREKADEYNESEGEGPRFLLVSDQHNINMTEVIAHVADRDDVDAVIDTGDLLTFGNVAEAEAVGMFKGIEAIGKPYIFVLGNHDRNSQGDEALLRRMAQIPNVLLLEPRDGEYQVVSFGDLTIAGTNDPRWYGDDNRDNNRAQDPAVEKFNDAFTSILPDVVVSHEPDASKRLGVKGLRLAGHIHDFSVEQELITLGTLTGGGLAGYAGEELPSPEQSYAIVDFGSNCAPRSVVVTRFVGGVGSKPGVKTVQYFPLGDLIQEDKDPADCSTQEMSVHTVPRVVNRALRPI